MKPIFENQLPFNPNFVSNAQSTPTAAIAAINDYDNVPDVQQTDLEANIQIKPTVKSQKLKSAEKAFALFLLIFIILGWFSS